MKNSDLTKRKLIGAVGEIFRTEGHAGLGVNKVARIACVNKTLIYRYFKNEGEATPETPRFNSLAEIMLHFETVPFAQFKIDLNRCFQTSCEEKG